MWDESELLEGDSASFEFFITEVGGWGWIPVAFPGAPLQAPCSTGQEEMGIYSINTEVLRGQSRLQLQRGPSGVNSSLKQLIRALNMTGEAFPAPVSS